MYIYTYGHVYFVICHWPPWALIGRALLGRALMGRTLMGRTLVGRALVGSPSTAMYVYTDTVYIYAPTKWLHKESLI